MERRVFVTGGAHGIGRSIVEAFCQAGDRVAFCDMDVACGRDTSDKTGAIFYQADVADPLQLEQCLQAIADEWGDMWPVTSV